MKIRYDLRVQNACEIQAYVARQELLEVLVVGRADIRDRRLGHEQHVIGGELS
jgi:hypothetical protein